MKNVIMCLMFMAAVLLAPSAAFSTEDQMIENAQEASMELSGTVTSVDIENQQVVIEYQLEGREAVTSAVFNLSETAEIYRNGEMVLTSDLREGDKVAVTYKMDDNGGKVILRLTLNN